MNCPHCGKEMAEGFVQSAREIFFTTDPHWAFFIPNAPGEISLSSHNLTRPTCIAYHCKSCKKVIIDYGQKPD